MQDRHYRAALKDPSGWEALGPLDWKAGELSFPSHTNGCAETVSLCLSFPTSYKKVRNGWFSMIHVTLICSSVFPSFLSQFSLPFSRYTPHFSPKLKNCRKAVSSVSLAFLLRLQQGAQLERSWTCEAGGEGQCH